MFMVAALYVVLLDALNNDLVCDERRLDLAHAAAALLDKHDLIGLAEGLEFAVLGGGMMVVLCVFTMSERFAGAVLLPLWFMTWGLYSWTTSLLLLS